MLEDLIEFVCLSRLHRRIPLWRLPIKLGWQGISVYTVRNALQRAGFKRYVALRKPPISEKNRKLRLDFALEYINWTDEQWDQILWSDETWVTAGSH